MKESRTSASSLRTRWPWCTSASARSAISRGEPRGTAGLAEIRDASKLLLMSRIRVAAVADVLLTEMGGVARSVRGITRELAQLDPDRLEVTIVARHRPEAMDGVTFRR